MRMRGALRRELKVQYDRYEERKKAKPKQKPQKFQRPQQKKLTAPFFHNSEGVQTKTKLDWGLDIFSGVFLVGMLINMGIHFGTFQQVANYQAMQSFLLIAILLQLMKIGRTRW